MVAPAQSPLVGEKYELLGRIGSGGMGEVWEARHHVTGRRVAVKLLRAGTKRREEVAKRFLREAQAIGRVEHPHVVEVLDAGIDPSTRSPYIVQALLRGVSLRRYLRTQTRLTPLEAASLVAPVLRGLSAAHVAGIVHRDIKPSNVILCRQPDDPLDAVTPKIIDFGISKLEEGQESDTTLSTLTASGVALGTVGYMAPEQAEGRGDVDGRADLWACGVMLFEMVAGRRPFDGSTTAQTLLRIVSHDAPSLDALGLDVPRGFTDLVSRALARKPSQRFLSALDMLEALEGAVGAPLRSASIVVRGASAASLLPNDEEPHEPLEPPASPTAETERRGAPAPPSAPSATGRSSPTVPAWIAWTAGAIALGAVAVALVRTPEAGTTESPSRPVLDAQAPDAAVSSDLAVGDASRPEILAPIEDAVAEADASVGPAAEPDAASTRARREPGSTEPRESRSERTPTADERTPIAETPDAGARRVGANGAAILGAE